MIISNYFVKPQNQKTFFFEDKILLKMNFQKKIELFKEICKREKFDKNKVSEIIKSIKFVQKIRNNVAHWQSESVGDKFQLRNRKSYTTKKDLLTLDGELINKLVEESSKATKGVNRLYLRYYKEGTVDERNIDEGEVM